jgi:hypothetical protein
VPPDKLVAVDADPALVANATDPLEVTNPLGLVLEYGVNPNPDVMSPLVNDSVPPRVKLPEVVTVPDKDKPDTVPVPLTLVTVPDVAHDKTPDPFVLNTWLDEPSADGNVYVVEPAAAAGARPTYPEDEPDSLNVPLTSNAEPGDVVPMPTLPAV